MKTHDLTATSLLPFRPLKILASTLAAAVGIACSSSSGTGGGGGTTDASHEAGPATDAGSDTGSVADAAEAGPLSDAGCVIVTNGASVVREQQVASDAPTPKGGTIPDGTYYVTAATIYTGADGGAGPTARVFQFTNRVSGGTYDAIEVIGYAAPTIYSGTVVTNGSNITIAQTCPHTDAGVNPYDRFDSDGTKTVTLYTSTPPIHAFTFTKQ